MWTQVGVVLSLTEQPLKIIILVAFKDTLHFFWVLMVYFRRLAYGALLRRLISEVFSKLPLELLPLHQELVMLYLFVNFSLKVRLWVLFVLALLPIFRVLIDKIYIFFANIKVH